MSSYAHKRPHAAPPSPGPLYKSCANAECQEFKAVEGVESTPVWLDFGLGLGTLVEASSVAVDAAASICIEDRLEWQVAGGNWQARRERQLSVLQLIEYHVQLNGISLFAWHKQELSRKLHKSMAKKETKPQKSASSVASRRVAAIRASSCC